MSARRFTGLLHCRGCGATGSCRDPSRWCRCAHHSAWDRLQVMCPDLPDPQQHGYTRVMGGFYEPVYARGVVSPATKGAEDE